MWKLERLLIGWEFLEEYGSQESADVIIGRTNFWC